jgi:hypothetical protein
MKASTKVIRASGELGHGIVTVALQFGHGSHHADLRAFCGEVLTARWAFKLELHDHQIFVAEKFIFNGLLAIGGSQNSQLGRLAN